MVRICSGAASTSATFSMWGQPQRRRKKMELTTPCGVRWVVASVCMFLLLFSLIKFIRRRPKPRDYFSGALSWHHRRRIASDQSWQSDKERSIGPWMSMRRRRNTQKTSGSLRFFLFYCVCIYRGRLRVSVARLARRSTRTHTTESTKYNCSVAYSKTHLHARRTRIFTILVLVVAAGADAATIITIIRTKTPRWWWWVSRTHTIARANTRRHTRSKRLYVPHVNAAANVCVRVSV